MTRKMRVVAKIERDAKNFFFVKMLYGFSNVEGEIQNIYSIEDEELIDNIISLSYLALNEFECGRNIGSTIIIYDTESKGCYYGYHIDYTQPNRIIVGTEPMQHFGDINYLIRMISYVIKKQKMGDFLIKYKDREMTVKEFYEYQKELSIYTE